MDCREIKKMIPGYLDNELEVKQSQLVREHLSNCPACRKELDAFKESWAMLGELNDIQPEPGFVGRFWTRLALEQSWQEKLTQGLRENFFKKRLVPVLAAACVVILAGSFVLYNFSQTKGVDRMLVNLNQDDLAMVENIELAENLELIEEIDFLEDLDIIENLDVSES